jgi:hypothetical protein
LNNEDSDTSTSDNDDAKLERHFESDSTIADFDSLTTRNGLETWNIDERSDVPHRDVMSECETVVNVSDDSSSDDFLSDDSSSGDSSSDESSSSNNSAQIKNLKTFLPNSRSSSTSSTILNSNRQQMSQTCDCRDPLMNPFVSLERIDTKKALEKLDDSSTSDVDRYTSNRKVRMFKIFHVAVLGGNLSVVRQNSITVCLDNSLATNIVC